LIGRPSAPSDGLNKLARPTSAAFPLAASHQGSAVASISSQHANQEQQQQQQQPDIVDLTEQHVDGLDMPQSGDWLSSKAHVGNSKSATMCKTSQSKDL